MKQANLNPTEQQWVQTSLKDQVLTIKMVRPEKLNGWTIQMIDGIKEAFANASLDDSVKAIVFTGSGRYFSAGVNLGGSLKLMHPAKLRDSIISYNQQLFETFLYFPKPILVAINGPAIGASVTSATLCDAIIASERATFSTPFAVLGVTPEGCSSMHLPRLIGEQNAERMLGDEGWVPNGKDALDIGLVKCLVAHDQLLDQAHKITKDWVANKKPRGFLAGSELNELVAINAKESTLLADAFLSVAFLKGQSSFMWRKNKYMASMLFLFLRILRPLWGRLL